MTAASPATLTKTIRCLTVRQPHAHHIFHCGKDVENRSKRTTFRGTLAIHVSKSMNVSLVRAADLEPGKLPRGAVIGFVDVVDCVRSSSSRWALPGHWHWILSNARLLKTPIPASGQLAMFDLTVKTERLATRQDARLRFEALTARKAQQSTPEDSNTRH